MNEGYLRQECLCAWLRRGKGDGVMVGSFQVKGQLGGSRRLSSVVFRGTKNHQVLTGAELAAGSAGVTEFVQLQR